MTWTFVALGPLGPLSASNETLAPSASVLKPLPAMLLWCTNRSLLWSSGVMKPKPFSSLNHLTVPVAIMRSSVVLVLRNAEDAEGNDCDRWHCLRWTVSSSNATKCSPPGRRLRERACGERPGHERRAHHRHRPGR